jgi:hypothetical protein
MKVIDQHLYGVAQAQRSEDFEESKQDGDRSTTGKLSQRLDS